MVNFLLFRIKTGIFVKLDIKVSLRLFSSAYSAVQVVTGVEVFYNITGLYGVYDD